LRLDAAGVTANADRLTCVGCGDLLPPNARFCPACGRPISPTQANLESAGLIRPAHLAGERKLLTVLFADVVNSTAIGARMEPEAWAELMNRAFGQLSPIIGRYDGTIARLMGDALLAFFGAPTAHEDDPARAVQAGLDLLDAARAFAEQVREPYAADFEIRVGISTGPVVLGDVGSNLKFEYTAMGDAVNLAARMQSAARPNTLLISQETHRWVAQHFACIDRGLIRVKGRSDPVRVYEVSKRREGRSPNATVLMHHAARTTQSPFVGRDREMGELRAILGQLRNGTGHLIGVLGEAGVGKSRLLAEFRQLAGSNVIWLEGRTLSFGRSIAYWPFREMLRDYAGILEDHSDAEAWDALQRRLAPLFPDELGEILPYLATLLGLTVPQAESGRVKYLDGEAMRPHVFRGVRRLVERLAQQSPVILVFEDLHWLDKSSADLLEHLLSLVYSIPLLICGASRLQEPGVGEGLRERVVALHPDCYVELRLAPLPATDSLQLLENLLAHDAITQAVYEPILSKTEGNPFFIEEVIRSLIELQLLEWDARDQKWRGVAALEKAPATLPDTIQLLIMARLDRLDDASKEVLKIAAVLGRRFPARVLLAVMARSGRVDQQPIRELVSAEVLSEERRVPELELGFKHALTQEAAYQSMPLRQRQSLHEQAGSAIEQLFATRLDEFAAHLAYHYSQADDWTRAEIYLLKAGDQAKRVAADSEALSHYRQALDVRKDRGDPLQRASLERKMAEALFRLGQNTEARTYVGRALAELGVPAPNSQLAVRAALAREATSELWRSAFRGRPDQRELAPPDARVVEIFESLRILCWVDMWTDRERFLTEALQVLRVCEKGRHTVGEIQALSGLGAACAFVGAFWLAEHLVRRALTLAHSVDHPLALGTALAANGVYRTAHAELSQAVGYFKSAATAFSAASDIRSLGAVRDGESLVGCLTGAFPAVIEQSQGTIRMGEESGDRHLQGWGFHTLGEAVLHTSGPSQAEPLLNKGLMLLSNVPDHLGVAHTLGLLGECALKQGDLGRALSVVERGLEHLETYRISGYSASAIILCNAHARILAAQSEPASSRRQALGAARHAVLAALTHGRQYRIGLSAAQRWEGTLEWIEGRPEHARLAWARSLETANRHEMRAELAATRLELGTRSGDETSVSQAHELMQSMGAYADLVTAPLAQAG
jgi:class 3 adenylate cyclase/tetratricopeptide (TPR) repeat protein